MRAIIKPQYWKIPMQEVENKETELECAVFNIKRTRKEHEISTLNNPFSIDNLNLLIASTIK
jgi:hypothetical protein